MFINSSLSILFDKVDYREKEAEKKRLDTIYILIS